MSVASHLERRGAVYYWRRRLPHQLARRLGQRFLVISLRTREHISARYIAAQLDAIVEKMTLTGSDHWVSRQQLQDFFRQSFRIHQELIRRSHAGYREDHREPIDPDGAEGIANGWVYRLIEKQGLAAEVGFQDLLEMQAGHLSDDMIDKVADLLKWHTAPKQAEQLRFSVARVLSEVGAIPTEDNVARAIAVFARAKSEAFFKTQPFDDDELDFDDLIAEAKADTRGIGWTQVAPTPVPDSVPVKILQPAEVIAPAPSPLISPVPQVSVTTHGTILQPNEIPAPAPPLVALPVPPVALPPPLAAIDRSRPIDRTIVGIGERLVGDQSQDGSWDEKMVRQARMITDLFGRFLAEERRITDLAVLSVSDLDAFDVFLRQMGKNYGKSAADKSRSIDELRRRWAALPAKGRGLEVKTRNKHFFYLNHLLARARKAGVPVDRDLSFSEFRAKPKGRARNDRVIPKIGVFEKIFDQPIYTGCAGWNDLFASGPHVFHRAAYFGPMFAHYHGLRREEFCGLELDDIVTDKGLPHIWVQPNALRLLKTDQSERQLALHPELLRLGLLDYVEALRAIGETRLFPELVSPSSKSPLGDRYYDEWSPGLIKLGFTPHMQRHFFNNALKQKLVTSEMRADLMGHGGKGETEERYADAYELGAQLDMIAKIPVVTAGVERRPVKLIPWVEKMEIAPWSRAAVAERREAAALKRASRKAPRSRRR